MQPVRIGLVSDTHNLLRPGAVDALRNSAHILHAGDICAPGVLDELQRLAPVAAVRGNNDFGAWSDVLPQTRIVRIEDVAILMVHDLGSLAVDPMQAGVQVVVSGHSHRPKIERRGGVLYVNPGSAGPRRFSLPISLGQLLVQGPRVEASLIDLMP